MRVSLLDLGIKIQTCANTLTPIRRSGIWEALSKKAEAKSKVMTTFYHSFSINAENTLIFREAVSYTILLFSSPKLMKKTHIVVLVQHTQTHTHHLYNIFYQILFIV